MKAEIGKVYRHYKGNIYKVLAITVNTETLEEMVAYKEIGPGADKRTWSRPREMFEGEVDMGGDISVYRFVKLETLGDWILALKAEESQHAHTRERMEKFKDQVKLTCIRAETAEEELESLKNMTAIHIKGEINQSVFKMTKGLCVMVAEDVPPGEAHFRDNKGRTVLTVRNLGKQDEEVVLNGKKMERDEERSPAKKKQRPDKDEGYESRLPQAPRSIL